MTKETKSNWVGKTYTVKGDWSFVEENEGVYFVLGDDFETNSGPDVKVYLSKKDINDIDNRESVDVEGVFLGEMEEFSGKQKYRIPDNVNLEDYKSLVIHCRNYSVVWAGVNIN